MLRARMVVISSMTLFFLLSEEAQLALCIAIARKCGRPERQRTKLEILSEQQNHRCCYCGIRFVDPPDSANLKKRHWKRHLDGHPRMASIEHVVRLIDGGQRIWENEVAACADCNQRRQHVDAYSFYTYRAAILSNIKRRQRHRHRERCRRQQKERRIAKQAALAKVADVWPQMVAGEGLEPTNVAV